MKRKGREAAKNALKKLTLSMTCELIMYKLKKKGSTIAFHVLNSRTENYEI
jgi:hypothetical protein